MKVSEELALNCCGQGCPNKAELVEKIKRLEEPRNFDGIKGELADHVSELEYLAFIVILMQQHSEAGFDHEVLRIAELAFAQVAKCRHNINMEAAELGVTATSNQYAANKVRKAAGLIDRSVDSYGFREAILEYAQSIEDGDPLE